MTYANIELLGTARKNLSRFIMIKADALARLHGFGYRDVDTDAPNSFEALVTAWTESKRTGLAFPVWSGCSDRTIYTSKGVNYAFRFWHDSLHAVHGLQFTTADEIEIGKLQVIEVQKEFGFYSLESLIMFADTIGQSLYASEHNGEFPENQYDFVIQLVGLMTLQAATNSLQAA